MLIKFFQNQSGATSIEYGAIGALLSIAVLTGAHMVGVKVAGFFAPFASALK